MRVAIASGFDKRNYGSMLQAYATERALREMGHEVVTIDRRGIDREIRPRRIKYFASSVATSPSYAMEKKGLLLHSLRRRVVPSFGKAMAARYRRFDAFRDERFALSPRFESFDELSGWCETQDVVLAGSDQLWTPANVAGDYYTLSFAPGGVGRVSFSTSFGVSSLSPRQLRRAAGFLREMDAISVREETGARLVTEASGRKAAVVCDPTFLLDAGTWSEVASGQRPLPARPYMLCYFLGRSRWHRDCARRLADDRGLAIVAVSHCDEHVAYDDRGYADVQPWDVGPAEWLALVKDASLVCTDSFHGTLFASTFHVPFVTFRRHPSASRQSTNARLDTLLGVLGLRGSVCEAPEALGAAMALRSDWGDVDARRAVYADGSREWLEAALEVARR